MKKYKSVMAKYYTYLAAQENKARIRHKLEQCRVATRILKDMVKQEFENASNNLNEVEVDIVKFTSENYVKLFLSLDGADDVLFTTYFEISYSDEILKEASLEIKIKHHAS